MNFDHLLNNAVEITTMIVNTVVIVGTMLCYLKKKSLEIEITKI